MKKISYIILPFILAGIAYFIFTSSIENNITKGVKSSDRKDKTTQLYYDLMQNGGIIIYPSDYDTSKGSYVKAAQKLGKIFGQINLTLKPDNEVSDEELKNNSVFLIGTFNSNKALKKFVQYIPVSFSRTGFSFLNKTYSDSTDMLSFFYDNPFNHKKIFYLITGTEDKYLIKNAHFNFTSDFRLTRNGECVKMGFFNVNDNGFGGIDKSEYWDFESDKKIIDYSDNYRLIFHTKGVNQNLAVSSVEKNDSMFQRMRSLFGDGFKRPKLDIHFYDNMEDKGLITGKTSLSHLDDKDNSIHVVLNDWISGYDLSKNALAYLRYNFGKPKVRILERGLSVYFTDSWRGRGYKYWANKIVTSENVPLLSVLIDDKKSAYESDLIVDPLSAVFIEFLLSKKNSDSFSKLYTDWDPTNLKVAEMESDWQKFIQQNYFTRADENEEDNFADSLPSFLKGFCFAHEGYQIHNGYLSRKSYNAMLRLKAMGVNSVSVTPFTSMKNPKIPEPYRLWKGASTENDESILFLKHAADELNFTVVLKPHIYLWNSWPGEIEMKTEKDWKKFFDNYYRWIRHYAFLAEMYRIPVFCIGNELSKTTIGHEVEWKNLINKIRKIYSGRLVYGANWGTEFENLSFWNVLDYMGISQYYPLSKEDKPTDEQLFRGATNVIEKIEKVQRRFGKPLIFTEVGYRSSRAPWKSSFEKEGRRDTNLITQQRCYQALFKAVYGKMWLAGMYWWKWPSYLEFGGDPEGSLYTPLDKPAGIVVKSWYSKNWN